MSQAYKKVETIIKQIREKTDFIPEIGLVLGSGLGNFAQNIEVISEIDYQELSEFPKATVQGHEGKFIFGFLNGIPLVCMKGRIHFYEGYPVSDTVLPIRVMKCLGAKILFLTNASGGMKDGMKAGDFMMLTDHISLFAPNPLIGENLDELGTRFPDMSEVYDKKLQKIIVSAAREAKVELEQGVYAQATGPCFETPAEIKMLKQLGADAVGMSTVIEAIAGVHCGMKVCAISCVCNLAAGICKTPLSHEEVQEAANSASVKFQKLITSSIRNMKDYLKTI